MQDEIILKNGKSRKLRTDLPEGTTWEEALKLWRAGELHVDFNGKDPEGIAQFGTELNKDNLLSDETAAAIFAFSSVTPSTVNDALMGIVGSGLKMKHGQYKGTGTVGSSGPVSIKCDFSPCLFFVSQMSNVKLGPVIKRETGNSSSYSYYENYNIGGTVQTLITIALVVAKFLDGEIQFWVSGTSCFRYSASTSSFSASMQTAQNTLAEMQLNTNNSVYDYIIIGK